MRERSRGHHLGAAVVELWVVFVVRVLVGACLRDIVIKITIHFGVEEIAEVVNRKSAVDHKCCCYIF